MHILRFDDPTFEETISSLEIRGEAPPEGVMERVAAIIEDVRRRGDDAVVDYTQRFDNLNLREVGIEIDRNLLDQALEKTIPSDREIIEEAARLIRWRRAGSTNLNPASGLDRK